MILSPSFHFGTRPCPLAGLGPGDQGLGPAVSTIISIDAAITMMSIQAQKGMAPVGACRGPG
jgi:hypothetical protein